MKKIHNFYDKKDIKVALENSKFSLVEINDPLGEQKNFENDQKVYDQKFMMKIQGKNMDDGEISTAITTRSRRSRNYQEFEDVNSAFKIFSIGKFTKC